MKANKLLSAAITAVMCLNLFAGACFALEDQQTADTSDAGQASGGSELESPAGENGGPAESAAGEADRLPDAPKSGKAAWTICVYMCGSDLESVDRAAFVDLLEMLDSLQMHSNDSPFPGNVNLLVMTGGAAVWDSEDFIAGMAAGAWQTIWRTRIPLP